MRLQRRVLAGCRSLLVRNLPGRRLWLFLLIMCSGTVPSVTDIGRSCQDNGRVRGPGILCTAGRVTVDKLSFSALNLRGLFWKMWNILKIS